MAECEMRDFISSRLEPRGQRAQRAHRLPGVVREQRIRLKPTVGRRRRAVAEKENAVNENRDAS